MFTAACVSSEPFRATPERCTARDDALVERFYEATVLQPELIARERLLQLPVLLQARAGLEHCAYIAILQSLAVGEGPGCGVFVIDERPAIQREDSHIHRVLEDPRIHPTVCSVERDASLDSEDTIL